MATDTSVDPNGINKEWFDISTQISQAAFAAGGVFENECKNKTDAVCVQDFIKNKGRLLFRHPLNTAEIAQFNTLQAKLTGLEKNEVLSFIFQAMLNSTAFLFVVESPGNATKEPDGSILLDSNSMATRLSLLIHDSSPSEALLQLAEKNMLTTPEQINSATQTLMKDAKFQRQSARFAKSWLKLNKLSEITKTGNAKTFFTANHVSSYTNETELFIGRYFATSGDATQAIPFSQLYNSQSTYINKFNAPIYGLDSNTDQASWQTLPPTHNGGILTQPSLLSQLATDEEGSIVRRGVFLIKEILCQPVGAPIKGAEFKPTPAGSAPMSARMQLAEHRKNPACSTCHNRIDNIGFGLEGFDGVGRVATLRPGALKDSVPWGTGFISWNANAGLTSNFSNPSEMGKLIAESNIGKACFVKKWFDSTLGIPMTIPATASLKSLINDFKTNPDGQELILKFTSSDIFRKRIFQ